MTTQLGNLYLFVHPRLLEYSLSNQLVQLKLLYFVRILTSPGSQTQTNTDCFQYHAKDGFRIEKNLKKKHEH